MVKKSVDFEEGLARLHELVSVLEGSSVPLEEGVALYKEGLLLVAACRERLDKARLEISVFKDSLLTTDSSDFTTDDAT